MPRATYSVASHVPWDRSEALEAARQALELHPTGDRNRWASLTDTGDVLRTRFRELGDLDLLTSAIDLFREALILRPRGHHDRSLSLEHLAEALWARCEQISDLDILAEAIELHREALDLRPPGHPHRPWSLNNLAIALQTRFEQLGELGALADAVDLHRQALDLRPPGHPDRPQSLNNLALSLWTQFEQLGDQDSLAEAVELHRQALDLRPPGHPDHSQTLNNLANALRTRFAQLGDQDSLAEAVELHRQALQLRPPGHPERSQSLNNLAGALQTRFEQLGDLNSLAEAVELHRQALDLRSLGHPGRSMSLSNLALSLHMRFNQLGDLDTLAEAVELHRQALDLRPQGHPDRLQSLNNLAIALKTRFEQLGDLDSLAEAVKLHHQALDVHPLGHPDRWYSLNSLANAMKARFHRLGDVESLANAVEMHRQALGLCPPGHPLRILSLHNLGCTLKTQSQRRKGINHAPRVQCSTQRGLPDVDEELGLYKEALRSCVSGHPLRIRLLFDIGTCLLRTGTHVHNFDEGMCYILEGLRDPASSAREAVGHAIDALPMIEVAYRLSTEQTDTVELLGHHRRELILEAYTLVIRYLPRVASLGLDHAGRFRELSGAEKISRNAAMRAIYSGRNADAIEMLEEGRGVFWSQALRLRTTDLDQLPTEDAQELRRFFRMLETGSARDESNNKLQREQHTEDRRRLSNVADSLIADIRSRPGMSRFLLPPSFSLLVQSLPETGSVVVLLTSDLGHRALVLDRATGLTASLELLPPKCGFLPEAVRVSLPRDGNARMEDNNVSRLVGFSGRAKQMPKEHLDQTRAQLWALIVKPVIDVLGLKKAAGSDRPRLWWCVTGELTFLSIHAAGIAEHGPVESISDYCVSSYIPTLSALKKSRAGWNLVSCNVLAGVLAACRNSPDWPPLASVELEIAITKTCFESASAQVSHISSPNTTVQVLRGALEGPSAHILHLACHGVQEKNPLDSAFLLSDGRLTIQDLMTLRLTSAIFAFLSACQTARGSEDLPDQAVHLAASMLFCGFRSIIGTMWMMNDDDGPAIARWFYEAIFARETLDLDDIAYALDGAVAKLCADGVSTSRWAAFIHMGG